MVRLEEYYHLEIWMNGSSWLDKAGYILVHISNVHGGYRAVGCGVMGVHD